MAPRQVVTLWLGAALALAAGATFGTQPASAQCSTITGGGMSGGGPCPTQRHYNYPTPSSSSGGTVYRGGGGGSNAGAAIGAAGAALGILGELIDAAREADQNEQAAEQAQQQARDDEARRQLAARQAYCRSNWQRASGEIQTGNAVMNQWKPDEASAHYERAIVLLTPCDDRRNIAIARHNLDLAHKKYAAVRDDNRVNDAANRYGNSNIYTSNNPFGKSGPDADSASDGAAAATASAKSIADEAGKRCNYAPAGSAPWKACMLTQEARLIMDADADIAGTCRLEANAAARDNCAIKGFGDKLRTQMATAGDNQNCYWDKNGQSCINGGGGAGDKTKPNAVNLRESLRAALARKAAEGAAPDAAAPTGAPDAAPAPAGAAAASDRQAPAPGSQDDALQAYLSAQNGSTGTRNDGNLGKADLKMDPADTRREIDRLTRPQ